MLVKKVIKSKPTASPIKNKNFSIQIIRGDPVGFGLITFSTSIGSFCGLRQTFSSLIFLSKIYLHCLNGWPLAIFLCESKFSHSKSHVNLKRRALNYSFTDRAESLHSCFWTQMEHKKLLGAKKKTLFTHFPYQPCPTLMDSPKARLAKKQICSHVNKRTHTFIHTEAKKNLRVTFKF